MVQFQRQLMEDYSKIEQFKIFKFFFIILVCVIVLMKIKMKVTNVFQKNHLKLLLMQLGHSDVL